MIDGSVENAIVSWLLNFRIRMFVKSTVIKHACCYYRTIDFFAYLEKVTPEGDIFRSKLQHVDDPE